MKYQLCTAINGVIEFDKIKINNITASVNDGPHVLEYDGRLDTCYGIDVSVDDAKIDTLNDIWISYKEQYGAFKFLKYRFENDFFYPTKYLTLTYYETLNECSSYHFVYLEQLPFPYQTDCFDYAMNMINYVNSTKSYPLAVYCYYFCTQIQNFGDAEMEKCTKYCVKTPCRSLKRFRYFVNK